MRRASISIAMLATVGLAVAAYAVNSRVSADRPDCPGQIKCPLTGERVCRDRCPLNKGETSAAQDTPPCCRRG